MPVAPAGFVYHYKEDAAQALQRHRAWWERELIDRVCIQVTAPRSASRRPDCHPRPASLERRWLDPGYVLKVAEEDMKSTYYGGDALPVFLPNLGPDQFSAYFGCDLTFAESTSWATPIIRDWDADAGRVRFDAGSRWWTKSLEITRAAAEAGRGRFFVALIDLHTGGDAVAAMRGAQNLCVDLLERPNDVKALMHTVTSQTRGVYEAFHDLCRETSNGSTTWLGVWSPGRTNVLQCDFITMISPAMFGEFFLDDIRQQAQWLDHSVFHLDGPGAVRHLDLLLDIPELDAIQWVPGAGGAPMPCWIPLLKRIQQGGKGLHIEVRPQDAGVLLDELDPRGLMMTMKADTVEEADALLKLAERASRSRNRGRT